MKLSMMKLVFSSQITSRNAWKLKCIFFFYVLYPECGAPDDLRPVSRVWCSWRFCTLCGREPLGVVFFPENLVTCVVSLILKLKLKLSLFFPPRSSILQAESKKDHEEVKFFIKLILQQQLTFKTSFFLRTKYINVFIIENLEKS